jgi:hypothetical protein
MTSAQISRFRSALLKVNQQRLVGRAASANTLFPLYVVSW